MTQIAVGERVDERVQERVGHGQAQERVRLQEHGAGARRARHIQQEQQEEGAPTSHEGHEHHTERAQQRQGARCVARAHRGALASPGVRP